MKVKLASSNSLSNWVRVYSLMEPSSPSPTAKNPSRSTGYRLFQWTKVSRTNPRPCMQWEICLSRIKESAFIVRSMTWNRTKQYKPNNIHSTPSVHQTCPPTSQIFRKRISWWRQQTNSSSKDVAKSGPKWALWKMKFKQTIKSSTRLKQTLRWGTKHRRLFWVISWTWTRQWSHNSSQSQANHLLRK
jgi:hypothetical protein